MEEKDNTITILEEGEDSIYWTLCLLFFRTADGSHRQSIS